MKTRNTLIAAGLAAAGPALAQSPALEEILVTAEFRATPLLNQSASTSVVTRQEISQRAA